MKDNKTIPQIKSQIAKLVAINQNQYDIISLCIKNIVFQSFVGNNYKIEDKSGNHHTLYPIHLDRESFYVEEGKVYVLTDITRMPIVDLSINYKFRTIGMKVWVCQETGFMPSTLNDMEEWGTYTTLVLNTSDEAVFTLNSVITKLYKEQVNTVQEKTYTNVYNLKYITEEYFTNVAQIDSYIEEIERINSLKGLLHTIPDFLEDSIESVTAMLNAECDAEYADVSKDAETIYRKHYNK